MVDDFRGRGGSPWGSPPPGGGGNGDGGFRRGPTPPNIDEIVKNLQSKINKFFWFGYIKGFYNISFTINSPYIIKT